MKTLSDICEVYSGYALKEFNDQNDGLPVIKIGNIMTDGTLALEECQYTSEVVNEKYYSKKGDIYVALSGATTGKIGILESDERHVINQRVGVVRRKEDDIPQQFVKYFLMRQTDRILQEASGCAQPNISPKQIAQYEVPQLSKKEMEEISNTLDKLSNVITQRKDELQKLDELIKARFVELFGDPVTNDKHWDMDTLLGVLEVGRTVTYGIVQTGDDVDEGIPVFRPIDIAGGHVPKREELKKTLPEISDKYKRTLLKGNELLITVRGSVGETFQVNEEFECCNVGRNIVPLVTDKKRVNQRFLQELFAQKPIKDWLKAITKGIALQGLNMSEFKEMPVIIPDMGLQEEYVEFVEQVDKSKVAVQKSLDETQKLFDSLMQQYFG